METYAETRYMVAETRERKRKLAAREGKRRQHAEGWR